MCGDEKFPGQGKNVNLVVECLIQNLENVNSTFSGFLC